MPNKLVFLKTDEDFDQFRRSKLFTSNNLRLRIRYNTNQNIARFGFIIPKKVLPKVTDRNKLKRRIKTVLAKHAAHVFPNDYLVFPQKALLKITFAALESELVNLIQKTKSWKY